MEFYDASAPASGDDRSSTALLRDLRAAGSSARLMAALDAVDEICDRVLEEESAEPLDADVTAALEQVTGEVDAPAHFTRIHERVEGGLTTWDRFWARPTDEYRGYEVIQAAIAATLSQHTVLPTIGSARETT